MNAQLARYRRYNVQLEETKDADVIAHLEAQPNKTDAIRRALRRQIEEEAQHEQETEKHAPRPGG